MASSSCIAKKKKRKYHTTVNISLERKFKRDSHGKCPSNLISMLSTEVSFFFPPQFNANPFSSPLRKLDRTLGFFFFNLCLGKNRWKNSLAPSCFHVSTRIQPLLERFSIASVCPRYLYTATWQEIFQYHG